MQRVFFLGSHPALSAAEAAAWVERTGVRAQLDLSRLPIALVGNGHFPSPEPIQSQLGGITMIGTLRATLDHWPTPEELVQHVPEMLQPRQGKRIIGLSALLLLTQVRRGGPLWPPALLLLTQVRRGGPLWPPAREGAEALPYDVRRLALDLKKHIGMKGTRVVFPPARRSDLSTAQLLHNRLPHDGVAVVFVVHARLPASPTPGVGLRPSPGVGTVDIVALDSIQDIEAYARRDRGRPHADPGTGMLPPKVAQMLLNLALVPPRGTIYDPFCGVGTIPMEAALMGLNVVASDMSPKQVTRTQENLEWLRRGAPPRAPGREAAEGLPYSSLVSHPSSLVPRVFVHNITAGPPPLAPGSVDAVVTEGSLGPPRTTPPLPREAQQIFRATEVVLAKLLSSTLALLRDGGRVVVTVPAFRIKKRVLHFPLGEVKAAGLVREPLVPHEWEHPLFREAKATGTLLYGRPDALVLREIVRWSKGGNMQQNDRG